MQVAVVVLLAALAMGWLPPPSLAAPKAVAAAPGEAVADRRADAEAGADPGTSSSFFDTFMAFLGSSAPHKHQAEEGKADAEAGSEAGREEVEAAASDAEAQQQQVHQGRGFQGYPGLHDLDGNLGVLGGPPLQDGGQADRVKRTGALPAQLLGGVINHKLGYISKGSHHVHFHNYNTKCEKAHFSLWEFKKGILHKLLEAAKAIGGGVLALKGKLITAKGHLVAAKGRKIATKGEELTEFGKSILAKALGHGGHDEVHTAPSAPSAPSGPAPLYGAPAPAAAYGYNYAAPQYLAPQYLPPQIGPAPGGHGYNAAVSLLDEYSRAGFGHAAPGPAPGLAPAPALGSHAHTHAHTHVQHRTGLAPTGPSATGSAGTLPGNLQAGLLVLQAAPSASGAQRGGLAAASSQHAAAVPAPVSSPASGPASGPASAPGATSDVAASETISVHTAQPSSSSSASSSPPLVLAPEFMDAMAAPESNKVRRYASPTGAPSLSRRSLDSAMAAVVRGLQGHDLLLHPDILRSAAAATSLATSP